MHEHSPIKCKVISLASASDRRDLVAQNLNMNSGLSWEFFDAITPKNIPQRLTCESSRQIVRFGRQLTIGEIACFYSHFTVLEQHSTTDGWLLVLEDDVWLDPDFDIKEIIQFADRNEIGYVRLYGKRFKPAKPIGKLSNFRQLIRFRTDPYGAQGYLISAKSAERFVGNVKAIDRPIDDELGRFWTNGLSPISVFPFPCIERSVPSSLNEERTKAPHLTRNLKLSRVPTQSLEKVRKIYSNLNADIYWRRQIQKNRHIY